MKKNVFLALTAALVLLMAACKGNQDNTGYPFDTKYLPVMLEGSQKWSILNLETGEVMAKDVFKNAPSAIVGDMFFAQNEQGTFDYYNVANVKTPVNKEHYGSATEFSLDGYAVASIPGKPITIINTKCEVVATLSDSIAECSNFNRGMAVARFLTSKYGYINTKGEVVVQPEYDQAAPFVYCDVAVAQNQRQINDSTVIADFSFINKQGEVTFASNNTMYNLVMPTFNKDVIPAVLMSRGDTAVCLNSRGEQVDNPFQAPDTLKRAGYGNIASDGKGNFIVSKGDKLGVASASGALVLPVKYFDVVDICANRYLVSEKQGVYTLVDGEGKPVGKAKIVHANGTPGAVAVRGFINTAVTATNLMSMFNDQGFIPVAKGAVVASFGGQLDVNHPEIYADQDGLSINSMLIAFEGPIVSKNAKGEYEFNAQTPVKVVSFDFPCLSYSKDTEHQLLSIMATNMGKNGFVSVGNNVFTSENNTAVALGHKNGVLRINYYMNAANAKPLPCEVR